MSQEDFYIIIISAEKRNTNIIYHGVWAKGKCSSTRLMKMHNGPKKCFPSRRNF